MIAWLLLVLACLTPLAGSDARHQRPALPTTLLGAVKLPPPPAIVAPPQIRWRAFAPRPPEDATHAAMQRARIPHDPYPPMPQPASVISSVGENQRHRQESITRSAKVVATQPRLRQPKASDRDREIGIGSKTKAEQETEATGSETGSGRRSAANAEKWTFATGSS